MSNKTAKLDKNQVRNSQEDQGKKDSTDPDRQEAKLHIIVP
jgi:hypothetical protein